MRPESDDEVFADLLRQVLSGTLDTTSARAAAVTGAEVIRADTDLGNRPMAAAFERAGYRNFARRLVLSAR